MITVYFSMIIIIDIIGEYTNNVNRFSSFLIYVGREYSLYIYIFHPMILAVLKFMDNRVQMTIGGKRYIITAFSSYSLSR